MDWNTLGEWSDDDDDWIWDIDENTLWEWSDSEADDIIRNVQTGRGRNVKAMSHCYRKRTFTKKRV